MVRVSYHPPGGDIRVQIDVSGRRADLRLSGCPSNNFRARVELPKSSELYVRMFAGQLTVDDVSGDKDMGLTFGQIIIDAGKPENYARVTASVNSGAIDANAFEVHKGACSAHSITTVRAACCSALTSAPGRS